MAKSRIGLLDSLVILFSAATLDLCILWAAGEISNDPIFTNLPGWLTGGTSAFWGFVTGGSAAALAYMKRRLDPDTESPAFLPLIAVTATALLAVVFGTTMALQSVQPSREPIDEFNLMFRIENEQRPATMSFIQWKPEYLNKNVALQQEYYEREHVDLPAPRENYVAEFGPTVEDSSRTDSLPAMYEICFTRKSEPSRSSPDGPSASAVLTCPDDRKCVIEPLKSSDWVEECSVDTTTRWLDWLVRSAFAQPFTSGWTVPSLETLTEPGKTGPGYTNFLITSDPLPGLEDADSFTYSIRVNDQQVFVDGWRPSVMREHFASQQGVRFNFGLQNLSFSGRHRGLEKIEVTLDFLDGDRSLGRPMTLSRFYAACTTDGKEITISDPVAVKGYGGTDLGIRWTANYVRPSVEDRFEIIARSSTDVTELEGTKRDIDRAKIGFSGQTILGVLRPPLDGNPHFAVMIGLERRNGQTQFTFNEQTADSLCRWVYENRGKFGTAVRHDIFRMENDLHHDDPLRRVPCSRL